MKSFISNWPHGDSTGRICLVASWDQDKISLVFGKREDRKWLAEGLMTPKQLVLVILLSGQL